MNLDADTSGRVVYPSYHNCCGATLEPSKAKYEEGSYVDGDPYRSEVDPYHSIFELAAATGKKVVVYAYRMTDNLVYPVVA
jgi:hypothetical protein